MNVVNEEKWTDWEEEREKKTYKLAVPFSVHMHREWIYRKRTTKTEQQQKPHIKTDELKQNNEWKKNEYEVAFVRCTN